MNKDIKTSELFTYIDKITKRAENMSLEELEDLGNTTGWLTLIDEEPEFADYVGSLSQEHMMLITEAVMNKVKEIYDSKSNDKVPSAHKFIVARKLKKYEEIDDLRNYEFWSPDGWTEYKYCSFYLDINEARSVAEAIAMHSEFVYRIIEEDEIGFTVKEYEV